MPNIKSAIKRVKVNDKKRVQNTAQKSALRTSIKSFEAAVQNKDVEKAAEQENKMINSPFGKETDLFVTFLAVSIKRYLINI